MLCFIYIKQTLFLCSSACFLMKLGSFHIFSALFASFRQWRLFSLFIPTRISVISERWQVDNEKAVCKRRYVRQLPQEQYKKQFSTSYILLLTSEYVIIILWIRVVRQGQFALLVQADLRQKPLKMEPLWVSIHIQLRVCSRRKTAHTL